MLIDELYGSESISEVVIIFYLFAQRITQIYRIMVAWLDNLSDMSSVKFLLYNAILESMLKIQRGCL